MKKIITILPFLFLSLHLIGQNFKELRTRLNNIEKEGDSINKREYYSLQKIFFDSIIVLNNADKETFLSLYKYSTKIDEGKPKINGFTNLFIDSTIAKSSLHRDLLEVAIDKKIEWISDIKEDSTFMNTRQKQLEFAINTKYDKIIRESILYYSYLNKMGDIELGKGNKDNALYYYNKVMTINFFNINNETYIKFIELYEHAGYGILTCFRGDYDKLRHLYFNITISHSLELTKKRYIEELGGNYRTHDDPEYLDEKIKKKFKLKN